MGNNFTFDRIARIGKFLAEGYGSDSVSPAMQSSLKLILDEWPQYSEVLSENRVFSNFIAIVVESDALFQSLDSETKNSFKLSYMNNWRRNELIKRQLVEISNAFKAAGDSTGVLLKGVTRLFDDLYPNISHRFMIDIDIYFENSKSLTELSNIGYQTEDIGNFDVSNFDDSFLRWYKTQDHHLPPLNKEGKPCRVEMHLSPVNLRAIGLLPEGILQKSRPLVDIPNLNAPTVLHQLIMNILHTKYGEQFTPNARFRIRNLLESYLLFQSLTPEEKSKLYEHFKSIEKFEDIEFWEMLCHQALGAQAFNKHRNFEVRIKMWAHMKFGQNQRVNTLSYILHFIYRLISRDIWTKHGRTVLTRKLAEDGKRKGFYDKLVIFFRP